MAANHFSRQVSIATSRNEEDRVGKLSHVYQSGEYKQGHVADRGLSKTKVFHQKSSNSWPNKYPKVDGRRPQT